MDTHDRSVMTAILEKLSRVQSTRRDDQGRMLGIRVTARFTYPRVDITFGCLTDAKRCGSDMSD